MWSEQEVETIQEEVYYHFVQLFHLQMINSPLLNIRRLLLLKEVRGPNLRV